MNDSTRDMGNEADSTLSTRTMMLSKTIKTDNLNKMDIVVFNYNQIKIFERANDRIEIRYMCEQSCDM